MKAIFFETHKLETCCLCGSSKNLTGEHKIKASVLRSVFGNEKMSIGQITSSTIRARFPQSAKSKMFHFSTRLCAKCNGSRTQAADREFDHFHSSAYQLTKVGEDPTILFQNRRYTKGSSAYLNLFRYFAKLLCCHMADTKAPRPVHMSRFAIGQSNNNCVWIKIDQDWRYKQISRTIGDLPYVAHGGLNVYGDARTNAPTGFHSTITVGTLRYVFFSRLTWLERCALRFSHPQFHSWCSQRIVETAEAPMLTDKMEI